MLILAVNPGSTSTRTALYDDERCVDSAKLEHTGAILDLPLFPDQYRARRRGVLDHLERIGVDPRQLSGFAARGGRLKPVPSGVYRVNEEMVRHARRGLQGQHPANIAVVMAREFESEFGVPGYTVDPISVDELDEVARITGLKSVQRASLSHALSMKSVAKKASRQLGIEYSDAKLIVVHLGGGGSISAHKGGRMVDIYNSDQEGPFAVERAGGLPTLKLLEYLAADKIPYPDAVKMLAHEGGFVSHFGMRNIEDILEMAGNDKSAGNIIDAYIYQIAKGVSSFLPIFSGNPDAVVFTGGVVHSIKIRNLLGDSLGFIGRLLWYPGEFEMEALAEGVRKVLNGEESPRAY